MSRMTKDYRWIDKDPMIDVVREGFRVTRYKVEEVAKRAYVHPNTIYRWLHGETKKPQRIPLEFVLYVLGIEIPDPIWADTGKPVFSKFKVISGGRK